MALESKAKNIAFFFFYSLRRFSYFSLRERERERERGVSSSLRQRVAERERELEALVY
jgi:hypothetical protein